MPEDNKHWLEAGRIQMMPKCALALSHRIMLRVTVERYLHQPTDTR